MEGENFYERSTSFHDPPLQRYRCGRYLVSALAGYYLHCGWKANTSMSAALHFMTLGFKGIDVVGTAVSAAAISACKRGTIGNSH